MSTYHPPQPAPQRRAKSRRKRGQSLVEYALTITLIFLVAQGAGRAIYRSFVDMVTTVRSGFDIRDDKTPTPGPAPTLRVPPAPPTLTPPPPTPVVVAMCDVPNLIGVKYDYAVIQWDAYGFAAGTLAKPQSANSTFVIGAQDKTAGSRLNCATTTMYVTPKTCTVPNLQNLPYSSARAGAWTSAGFQPGNLQPSPDSPADFTIYTQSLNSGTAVDCESTMQVEPRLCTVPDLDGDMYNDVKDNNEEFKNAGFTSNLATTWGTANRRIGGSSPAAGARIECSAVVTVSEKMCTVPDLANRMYDDVSGAGEAFPNAGFTFTLGKAWSTNPANRLIGSTSPVAGSQVLCSSGSVQAIEKMCMVPDLNGRMFDDVSGPGEAFANAGFSSSLVKAWGTNAPANRRIGTTSPAAGQNLACNTTVTVNEKQCVVPDLRNKSFSEATTLYAGSDFTQALGRGSFAPTSGEFTVDTQGTAAGSSVACSTVVTVNPKVCTVPNMLKRTVAQARSDWSTAGFTTTLAISPANAPAGYKVNGQTATSGAQLVCTSPGSVTAIDGTPVVTIVTPANNASGDNDLNNTAPVVEASAFDPEEPALARGISRVDFVFTSPGNVTYTSSVAAGTSTKYCAFGASGSNCRSWRSGFGPPAWNGSLAVGTWTIKAIAYPVDGSKGTVFTTITFTVND